MDHDAIRKAYPNVVTIIDDGDGVKVYDAVGNLVVIDPVLVAAAAAQLVAEQGARKNYVGLIERRARRLEKEGDDLGAIRLRLSF